MGGAGAGGIKTLPKEADLVVQHIRFRITPPEQLQIFQDHFNSGKPAIAFRTINHGMWLQIKRDGSCLFLVAIIRGIFCILKALQLHSEYILSPIKSSFYGNNPIPI